MALLFCVQGDLGPAGPPGPVGETGHGLPGPKVNTAVFVLFYSGLEHFFTISVYKHHHAVGFITGFCFTRVIEVIMVQRVQSVQRAKAAPALWYEESTKT